VLHRNKGEAAVEVPVLMLDAEEEEAAVTVAPESLEQVAAVVQEKEASPAEPVQAQ
jgi:hypothetical protein